MPIGWTVSVSPSATTSPCSSPKRAVTRPGDEEQDQPEVADERRQLRPAVAVAVQEPRRRRGRSRRRTTNRCRPERAGDRPRPTGPGPAAIDTRSGRRGSKYAGGWTTRIAADCCHSRGVRSSVQTRIENDEHEERDAERRRGEDVEQLEPLQEVDQPDAEHRLVDRPEPVHLGRVVAGGAEGEAGQLADRHAEHRQHRDRRRSGRRRS